MNTAGNQSMQTANENALYGGFVNWVVVEIKDGIQTPYTQRAICRLWKKDDNYG